MRGELAAPLLAGFCAGSPLSQGGRVASCAAAAEFGAAEGLPTGVVVLAGVGLETGVVVLAAGGLETGGGVLAAGGLETGGGVLAAGGLETGNAVLAAGVCADFLASKAGSGFSGSVSRLFFPPIRRGRVARGRE